MEPFDKLPFAPGEGPFRVKGLAYRGLIKRAERSLPGGMAALLEQVRGPELRRFFQQQFLAASWYDVFPLLASAAASARILGLGFVEYVRKAARQQAEEDVNGIYRLLLKLTSAQSVALRMPRLSAQYFDFGNVEVRSEAPHCVEGVRAGIPLILVPWYVASTEGYVAVALEIAGARSPRVIAQPPVTTGSAHGIPLASVTFHILWE